MTKLAGYLSFHESSDPIREPVTKFGGRPNWLTKPEWPINAKNGEPMMFLGQVYLDREIFGNLHGQMAYLFFPELNPLWAVPDPDSAGNAVVIQPGEVDVPTRPLTDGPAVCRVVKGKRKWIFFHEHIAVPSDIAVTVMKREEPAINWDDDSPLEDTPHNLEDCKIGGETIWIQQEEWPYEDSRHLLLQLVWGKFPFRLSLGDAGTLYAFLNRDGTKGKMLWQCY